MGAYASGWEHLEDEWRLLNLRIQRLMNRQQEPDAAMDDPMDAFRGLVVSEQEVFRLLQEPSVAVQSDEEEEAQIAALREEIAGRVLQSAEEGVFLPLSVLAEAFALSPLERECVLLSLAVEYDRKYEKFYAFLQDDVTLKHPTVELALQLLGLFWQEAAAQGVFAPDGTLFSLLLKREEEQEKKPLRSRELKLDERVARFLLGQGGQEEALARAGTLFDLAEEVPELLWEQEVQARLQNFFDAEGARKIVCLLYGNPGSGKKLHVKHLCRHVGKKAFFLDLSALVADERPPQELLKRAMREAMLQRAVLCLTAAQVLLEEGAGAKWMAPVLACLRSFAGHAFLLSEKAWKEKALRDLPLFVEVGLQVPPDPVRKRLWELISGEQGVTGVEWSAMASKFRFTVGQIRQSLKVADDLARWHASGEERIDLDTLHAACYTQVQHKLEKKATRIRPKYDWDDLVLPPEQKDQLRNACNQVKYRGVVYGDWGFERRLSYGKGLSMMFSGPPGTGKTMSAEVIAKELSLEIYKIDLSQVISKYIGETEKNLQEIFGEAQLSSSILFFDEADALFGKRSEVKDSHDKYANVETAYLLQKMEEYEGITILATNYQQNIDEAFLRRINYVVKFPFPDSEYREKIWRGMFPDTAPVDDDVDFRFLAQRIELAGGNIKNIVVSAAFLGAEAGTSIGMKQLIQATKHELKKSGKLLLREELGEYYDY